MSQTKFIKTEDVIFLELVGFTFLLIGAALLWNKTHAQYYVDWQWINPFFISAAGMFALYYFFGLWITKTFPYFSIILKSIGMIFLTWMLLPLLNTAAFTTPVSTLYDVFFNHVDQQMGFHFLRIMQWFEAHPLLNTIAIHIYVDFLFIALLFPVILAIAKQEKAVYEYYGSFIILLMLSFTIYYFVPTTSPADVYPHPYFSATQIHLTHYFQEEHHYQPFHFAMTAIIGFPSLHAGWAVLFSYYLFQYRWTRWFAVLYLIFIIIAIFPTGWHFLSDIISGVMVALVAIGISIHLLRARS